jgi:hypothetical protein
VEGEAAGGGGAWTGRETAGGFDEAWPFEPDEAQAAAKTDADAATTRAFKYLMEPSSPF